MPQLWTCPRGHRWEGEVKGSVDNPRTRVLCPVCGTLAMTPVRVAEGKPASPGPKQPPPVETLAETLPFSELNLPANPLDKTLPDLAVERGRRTEDKQTMHPGVAPDPAVGQPPAAAPPAPAPSPAPGPGKEQPDR